MDDFVRNFMVRMGLTGTLEKFETEWYEMEATGKLNKEDMGAVPDVYNYNQELNDQCVALRREVNAQKAVVEKATSTWEKFRKERDVHRMHHKRIGQEKNKLLGDIKKLRKHYAQYEPTIKELKRKYELAMKEKMLVRIERDRLLAKLEAIEVEQAKKAKEEAKKEKARKAAAEKAAAAEKVREEAAQAAMDAARSEAAAPAERSARRSVSEARAPSARTPSRGAPSPPASDAGREAGAPEDEAHEPDEPPEPVPVENFKLSKTFKGHLMSVSNIALHPKKSILATASDDATWKMWDLPNGNLIMSGDGHKDWVAGVNFHPAGTHLASASGDCTVKIWDFAQKRCTMTLTEHTAAVWNAAFHDTGDYLASCSLDHSVRLWDLHTARCRLAFRGHVDSVNEVCWQPFTNNFATGSSDKTVSLWDMRTGNRLRQRGVPFTNNFAQTLWDMPPELREPPDVQHERRCHRIVRRRRTGEAVGRAHGRGDVVCGLRAAPGEQGFVRPGGRDGGGGERRRDGEVFRVERRRAPRGAQGTRRRGARRAVRPRRRVSGVLLVRPHVQVVELSARVAARE